jgi:hypothetical protein
MRYCVDVGYPFDMEAAVADPLQEIMGEFSDSAGAGFGMRDEQWLVNGHSTANDLAARVATLLGVKVNATAEALENPGMPYVAVYWEPKNELLWLVIHKDWSAIKEHILGR